MRRLRRTVHSTIHIDPVWHINTNPQASTKMTTTNQEESAHDAARDAALLKKLKGHLQSDDVKKNVCCLQAPRKKLESRTSQAVQDREISLTHGALASMIPTSISLAGSQKPNSCQQRVASTEAANSSGDSLYRRNTSTSTDSTLEAHKLLFTIRVQVGRF